jgi:hypothetical protein
MLFDQFGQRLQLKFVRNSCENQTVAPVGASAPQFYRDNLNHPIAQIDLERYRGTQTRILAQKRCNCSSLYAIESIDGQALPASVLRSDKILNSKEHEATRKDWDQRLAEYNANKKPNQSTVSSGKTV